MIKGAFGIEVIRNGRKLKLDFNNRILTSGLDFQHRYSVSNSTDSIIKDLMFGGAHSVIDGTTTGMSSTPLDSISYMDYVTPDFSDSNAQFFVNRLIFRFNPTKTMVIKQLGTGRKNTSVIGDVTTTSYDFFSLANLRDSDGNLAELTVYQGDIITVTYDLTIFNYVNLGGYVIDNKDILWNMLRANPNWQLSGFTRKLEVAKQAVFDLWGKTYEPFVVSSEIRTPSSNETYYHYTKLLHMRNITLGWKVGDVTKETLEADVNIKKCISMAGPLPFWRTLNGIYYYTTNGVNYITSTTNVLSYIADVDLTKFDPNGLYVDPIPVITSFTKEILWGDANSSVRLKATGTPFSQVYLLYKGKVFGGNHNGDENVRINGYTNKQGEWFIDIPISTFVETSTTAASFGGNFELIMFNRSGKTTSHAVKNIESEHGLKLNITKLRRNTVNNNIALGLAVQCYYTPYGTYYNPGTTDVTMYISNTGVPEDYVYGTAFYIKERNYNSVNSILGYFETNINVGDNPDIDLLDGTWVMYIRSGGLSYELPLGAEETEPDRTSISVSTFGVGSGSKNASKVAPDLLLVTANLTKLS